MALHKPLATSSAGSARALAWPVMLLLVSAVAIVAASEVPAPLVSATISVLLVLTGFAIAAVYYLAGHRMGRGPSSVWETAGALVFLGFAMAMLTHDEQALSYLAQMQTHLVALLQ